MSDDETQTFSSASNMRPPPTAYRTRLAPSPTGALHLGNARTFLINWALAKQREWSIQMRIEDLDGPRIKSGAAEQAMDDLAWLGLDWDGPAMVQSYDLTPYREALEKLYQAGLIYPCRCTRRDIREAQSAPHGDEENSRELRYPGTCRPEVGEIQKQPLRFASRLNEVDSGAAWRVRVPDEDVVFEDGVAGAQRFNVQRDVGDFVVATKAGLPAYQLAVVVDDARQGVTHVVRGNDLLASTARQIWLHRLLNLDQSPCYFHLPLVVGEDGRRLAKRHGDTRLAEYRSRGVPSERVVGLLAYWSGVLDQPQPMSAAEFARRFDVDKLPRGQNVVYSKEDEQWLMEAAR